MTPASYASVREKEPARRGCSPESRQAVQRLSGETQKYFIALWSLMDRLDDSGTTARALKPILAEQILALNERLALITTILETDSSEILRYVRKEGKP
jgi:hypothetical protein